MKVQTLRASWDDFWFTPQSPVPIALFRILFGFVVLCYGMILAPDLFLWFGDKGVISLKTAEMTGFKPHINLLACLPSGNFWILIFFLSFMLFALALTFGICTRLSSVVVWLGLATLYNRDLTIANGATILMLVLSFLLIFTHAGAAVSMDRLWRIARGRETEVLTEKAPWGQRLIQIQLSLVYFWAFLFKIQSSQWVNGTALYYIARSNLWLRFGIPFGGYLWATAVYSWLTLLLEFSLSILIWFAEFRYFVLLAGFLFHLGMEFSLNIPWFQITTLSPYVTFIRPEDLRRLMDRIRVGFNRQFRMDAKVLYNVSCEACVRMSRLVRALDLFHRIRWGNQSTLSGHPFEICLSDDRRLHGFEAFRWLLGQLPLLWPMALVASLPLSRSFFRALYNRFTTLRFCLLGIRCQN